MQKGENVFGCFVLFPVNRARVHEQPCRKQMLSVRNKSGRGSELRIRLCQEQTFFFLVVCFAKGGRACAVIIVTDAKAFGQFIAIAMCSRLVTCLFAKAAICRPGKSKVGIQQNKKYGNYFFHTMKLPG